MKTALALHEVASGDVLGTAILYSLGCVTGALAVCICLGATLSALAWRLVFFDSLLSRLVELRFAFPAVVLVPVLLRDGTALGAAGLTIVVFGISRAIHVGRTLRDEMRRVERQRFVLGARALGLAEFRIWAYHLLPHAVGPALVSAALVMPMLIALEIALAAWGASPVPSLGAVLISKYTDWLDKLGALAVVVGTSGGLYVSALRIEHKLGRTAPARTVEPAGR